MVDLVGGSLGFSSAMPGSGASMSTSTGFGGGIGVTRYPSPFFDIARNYLPREISELFNQCEYYALTHPLIATIVQRLSAYGMTDLVYETGNDGLRENYTQLFEKNLRLRQFLVECLLDYHAYGNAFITIIWPFRKYLTCRACQHTVPVDRSGYRYQDKQFKMTCKKCGHYGVAKARDKYRKSAREIRLRRWHPRYIRIEPAGVTGEVIYRYWIPPYMRQAISTGRSTVVENTPQIILDALAKNRPIVFNKGGIFHLKRGTISRESEAWGMPLLFPVLKDAYYLQILKCGQEAVAEGHIVPLRVLFPQVNTGAGDPYSTVNLQQWQERVQSEIKRWQKDRNYIPVMPLPIGYQSIGGDGRALLLHQEIRIWSEHICAGMGVPVELVFGGLSWSGSNVSLRMLENVFLGIREDALNLVEWIRDAVCLALRWPIIPMKFKDFKMADDLQRNSFNMQLAGQKKLSWTSFLEAMDIDYQAEQDQVRRETGDELEMTRQQQLSQAETQGRAGLITSAYQAKAQEQMQASMPQQPQPGQEQQGQPAEGPPPGAEQSMEAGQSPMSIPTMTAQSMGGVRTQDPRMMAASIATQMQAMPPGDRDAYLGSMQAEDPALHQLVVRYLMGLEGQAMRPLPEQRPPNRAPERAMI